MPLFSLNQQLEELVKTMLQEEQILNTNINNNKNNDKKNNNNNKIITEDESGKSPDFFQDNKSVKKEKLGKKYRTTRIKSINLLSNISYIELIRKVFTTRTLFLTSIH